MGGPDRDAAFAVEEEAADVTRKAEGAAFGEVDISAHEGLGKDDQPAADVGVGRANLDCPLNAKLRRGGDAGFHRRKESVCGDENVATVPVDGIGGKSRSVEYECFRCLDKNVAAVLPCLGGDTTVAEEKVTVTVQSNAAAVLLGRGTQLAVVHEYVAAGVDRDVTAICL